MFYVLIVLIICKHQYEDETRLAMQCPMSVYRSSSKALNVSASLDPANMILFSIRLLKTYKLLQLMLNDYL